MVVVNCCVLNSVVIVVEITAMKCICVIYCLIKSGLDSCIALTGFARHPVLGCRLVSFSLRSNLGPGCGFDRFHYSVFVRMIYLIQNFLVTLIMMVWLSS